MWEPVRVIVCHRWRTAGAGSGVVRATDDVAKSGHFAKHRSSRADDDVQAPASVWRDFDISHLYASPIMTARAGSANGYDIVDPTRVNPELGGEQGFRRLVAALRQAGLGIIVDIVPNHMAVGGDDNPW
jgi:maltooligosyltrehalose synthase